MVAQIETLHDEKRLLPASSAHIHGDGADEETQLLPAPPHQHGGRAATTKVILAGAIGMFTDGWDLQVINLVLAVMAHLYPGSMTPEAEALAASMTLLGVIIGQVSFGVIADIVGRRNASIATATLTIVGMGASACVVDRKGFHIASALAACRLCAGIGIGGEYPLSAAISKEVAPQALCLSRVQLLVVNMTAFNVGSFCQALLVFVLAAAGAHAEVVWRAPLVVGTLPSLVALAVRLQMEEPAPARGTRGRALASYIEDVCTIGRERLPVLFGCCISWMLYNFSAYGQSSFASIICDELLGRSRESVMDRVMRNALFAMVGSSVSMVGNFISYVLFSNGVSNCHHQAMGFVVFAAWIFLCSVTTHRGGLGALFFMLASTMNGIMGCTTYVVPTESFPAKLRGTAVGLSAAFGKIGALVGTATFPLIESSEGLQVVLSISSFVSLTGALNTLIFTPSGQTE